MHVAISPIWLPVPIINQRGLTNRPCPLSFNIALSLISHHSTTLPSEVSDKQKVDVIVETGNLQQAVECSSPKNKRKKVKKEKERN